MEKEVAIREWCIDKALTLILANKEVLDVASITQVAKQIESYILGE